MRMMEYFASLNNDEESVLEKYALLYSPPLSSYSIVTLANYIRFPKQNILIAIASQFSEIKKIKTEKQHQQSLNKHEHTYPAKPIRQKL